MNQSFFRALPSVLLFAEIIKIILKEATFADSIVAACLCALVGIFHVYNHIKYLKTMQDKFDKAAKEIQSLSDKIDLATRDAADAKSYVATVKMSTQLRTGGR